MRFNLCLLLLLLLIACGNNTRSTDVKTVESSVANTAAAPATVKKATRSTQTQPSQAFPFNIDLTDADGKKYNSKDVFKKNGKPTVLLFWLTTCGPCHMKLNAIKPIYPEWKEQADFNIYAVSGDWPKNYEKFVKQTKSKRWEWETYHDSNRAFKDILPGNLNGYPQTFIFDKDGKLVYQDRKYRVGDEKKLFKKIQEVCIS